MEKKQFTGRLFFLDNLRCFIVLAVVVFHVALGYAGIIPWWYVIDSNSYGGLYYFILLCNIFMMPILFFVAGYFAIPSLERHGATVFLKRKLMRLGIPYMICVSLVSPTFCYIRHRIRSMDSNSVPLGYWEFWLSFLKRIGRFEVHIDTQSIELAVNPYWFLLLLLLFFVVLCLLYNIGKKWTDKQPRSTHPDASSKPNIIPALISVWFITFVAYYVMGRFMRTDTWITLGDAIQIQPVRIPFYACYFAFGIYASSKSWFNNRFGGIGKFRIWLPICILSSIVYFKVVKLYLTSTDPSSVIVLSISAARMLVCLSCLVVCVSFAHRYWNRRSSISHNLASNSYNIYLAHYLIVVLFQWSVLNMDVPALVKFAVVSILSIIVSYGISQFIMRRSGWLTVTLVTILHITMCIQIR